MATLRDFLNWFEGISENIEGAPNDKQWAKIKTKLLALKDSADANAPEGARFVQQTPVVALPADVDPDPRGSHTVTWWKGQVLNGLLEVYDEKDARNELAKIPVDLNQMPEDVVARFIRMSA